jgi:hypothetical protein
MRVRGTNERDAADFFLGGCIQVEKTKIKRIFPHNNLSSHVPPPSNAIYFVGAGFLQRIMGFENAGNAFSLIMVIFSDALSR